MVLWRPVGGNAVRGFPPSLSWSLYLIFFFLLIAGCAFGSRHHKPSRETPRVGHDVSQTAHARKASEFQSPDHLLLWKSTSESFSSTAQKYAEKRSKGVWCTYCRTLLLLGDDTTEAWLGKNLGQEVPSVDGNHIWDRIPWVLSTWIREDKLDPLVIGISGDQTQHLLYHLKERDVFLPPYDAESHTVSVVLIGTNNLAAGHTPHSTAKGVMEVAHVALEKTAGHVVVVEILPRSDGYEKDGAKGETKASFMPLIEQTNQLLRTKVRESKDRFDGRLSIVGCGHRFLKPAYRQLMRKSEFHLWKEGDPETISMLMEKDGVHLSFEGHKRLQQCLRAHIMPLIPIYIPEEDPFPIGGTKSLVSMMEQYVMEQNAKDRESKD